MGGRILAYDPLSGVYVRPVVEGSAEQLMPTLQTCLITGYKESQKMNQAHNLHYMQVQMPTNNCFITTTG